MVANQKCPLRNKSNVSIEKAEKVVNPPSKPVAKKSFISCETCPLPTSPKTIPIKKQPTMFTVNVPNGNIENELTCTYCDKRYRKIPPAKLPAPIKSNIFIFFNYSVKNILYVSSQMTISSAISKINNKSYSIQRIRQNQCCPQERY